MSKFDATANKDLSDLIKEEYKILIARRDLFETQCISIKGWVSVGALASFSLVYSNNNYIYVFLVGALILSAWYYEAHIRTCQEVDHMRIMEIESYFKGTFNYIEPFQIANRFVANARELDGDVRESTSIFLIFIKITLRNTLKLVVCLPYLPLIIIGLILILNK